MNRSILSVITILCVTGIMHGCAAVVVGGAAATATVAHDRRTTGVFVEDQNIEFKAVEALNANSELKENSSISVTSYNRVVLLTGQAANQQLKTHAQQLAANIEQVRRVVNEIEIGSNESFSEYTLGSALVAEIKLKLSNVDIPDFDSLRVKVIVERGTVYLMGLLTPTEAAAVTDVVRHVSGVHRVVKVFEYYQPPEQLIETNKSQAFEN